ncbi:MAG TPA: hypothetical protein VEI97_18375, partial [bacterium]|nr:hypothetical protein [bacterium]
MKAITILAAAGLAAIAAHGAIAQTAYKAPRTVDGVPDLQGNWNNSSMTSLERQPKYGDRLVMTPKEVADFEGMEAAFIASQNAPTDPNLTTEDLGDSCGHAADSGFNPEGRNLSRAGCGYNYAWVDPGSKVMRVRGEPRTGFITSTANGRVPPLKPEAAARNQARGRGGFGSADNPENRSLGDRCVTSWAMHAGPVMLSTTYNNNYQIVQDKDVVAIMVEVVHDTRIVRLNAKHAPPEVRPYYGDSVGWYEGESLVVETTNYHPNTNFRGANPETLKVTERFTRTAKDKLLY